MKFSIILSLLFVLHFAMSCSQSSTPKPLQSSLIPFKPKSAVITVTAKDSELRLTKSNTVNFKHFGQPLESQVAVFIDPSNTGQTLLGIGAALTDAAAETFSKLPKATQSEILTAYFDKENGISYSFARVPIASSDFGTGTFNYVEPNDSSLSTFSIKHDESFRIPFIKQAISAAGGSLSIMASPWSPPAWMKDNNNSVQGGKLLPKYYQSWANHYVKFIKSYEAMGIPIWGLSVQNEPMAVQRWESCIYTAEEERDFIKNFLGPTLVRSGLGDKKLIAWDHNRDLIYQRASTILNDADAAKYVYGIGFHWYETWTGSAMQFDNLKLVKSTFPEKELIFTEGCVEKFSFDRIPDWTLGERYAHSMIHDFNSGTAAWIDWNILLDENGGPNHVGNFCFAPIHADTRNGKLLFTNSYYYLGHFSKFITSGAKRVNTSSNRDILEAVSFKNPNGEVVCVVLNRTDQPIVYRLYFGEDAAEITALPRSLSTIVITN